MRSVRSAQSWSPARTYRPLTSIFAITLALAVSALADAQSIDERLRTLITRSGLNNASVGVLATDLSTGRTLASYREDTPLIPASNQKVFTSGAALQVLGRDFNFQTRLLRDGGVLWIVGDGDPGFADPDLLKEMGISLDEFFDVWIDAIRRSGDEPIAEVIADARIFDEDRVHESWPQDQVNRWYCAEVSGLNFFTNVIHVYAQPTRNGAAPVLSTEPSANWLAVRNRGQSVSRGTNTLWVSRGITNNEMTLRGNVRWATEEPVRVALHDPALIFARLLAERVTEAGLGSPTPRTADENDPIPSGELVTVVRTPLSTALRRCNVDSHNLYAEAILKRIGYTVTGQQGSWGSGAAVVRMAVGDLLGPQAAAAISVADGSGMSRDNLATARVLVDWLGALHEDGQYSNAFYESLPQAGVNGTLRNRFRNSALSTEVRAKSGYLDRVSNLSGYIRDESTGQTVAFAILVNDFPSSLPVRAVKTFHEDVVEMLDEWLVEQRQTHAGVRD